MAMVKHRWWNTFVYVFVLQTIISMLVYVFNIPYIIMLLKNTLTADSTGTFGLTFSYIISTFGTYLLQTIFAVGLGVRFFSLLEEKENETLLDKIDRLGQDIPAETNEDEGER